MFESLVNGQYLVEGDIVALNRKGLMRFIGAVRPTTEAGLILALTLLECEGISRRAGVTPIAEVVSASTSTLCLKRAVGKLRMGPFEVNRSESLFRPSLKVVARALSAGFRLKC